MTTVIAQSLLDVDFGLFAWILITFLLFMFILAKFAWKPILNALKERESSIKDSLESAEIAMEQAKKISADNEKAMKEAEQKAQEIRKQAVDEAEAIRQERIEKSRKEAEAMLEQARETIEQEKQKALVELRKEVADLAVQAASKIIESELDDQKNKKLVEEYIKDISKN